MVSEGEEEEAVWDPLAVNRVLHQTKTNAQSALDRGGETGSKSSLRRQRHVLQARKVGLNNWSTPVERIFV